MFHGSHAVYLQENKRILKWRPFWNKVYNVLQLNTNILAMRNDTLPSEKI